MRISNKTFLLLLAGILLAATAGGWIGWSALRGGTQVRVTVGGTIYGTYPLDREQTVVIAPADGSWHNTLRIADGRAEMVEADCSNQICVHTPPLREQQAGVIVCLPHGVVVELTA